MKPRKTILKRPPDTRDPDAVREEEEREMFLKAVESISNEDIRAHKPVAVGRDEPGKPEHKPRNNKIVKKIDLHGFTAEHAMEYLSAELDAIWKRGGRVSIIVGKGNNAPGGVGVLRQVIPKWLDTIGREYVAEWKWARRKQGGGGAIIARLRGS